MLNKNLSNFEIGVLEGFGAALDPKTNVLTIDPHTYNNKFPELADRINIRSITPVDFEEFNSNVKSLVSSDSVDDNHVDFLMGFINANAMVYKNNSIMLTFKNTRVSELLGLLVTPSEFYFYEATGSHYAIYSDSSAIDLLNLSSVRNTGSKLVRRDLEGLRLDLNYENRSSKCPVMPKDSIKVKLLSENAVLPSKSRASDTGYDLTLISIVKRVHIDTGDVVFYGTGVAVTPPRGYYFDLVPRSSMSKQGIMLANSVGIIDRTYRGEIIVPIKYVGGKNLELPAKVVQLIPRAISHFDVEQVTSLDDTARSGGGFGSTGA